MTPGLNVNTIYFYRIAHEADVMLVTSLGGDAGYQMQSQCWKTPLSNI